MSQSTSHKRAFLRWAYDRLWHRWPVMIVPLVRRFLRDHGYFPNLLRPRSLNEKVLYRMLSDRRTFLPTFAGKLESREFVSKRVGSDILIPQFGVVYDAADVRTIPFPSRF